MRKHYMIIEMLLYKGADPDLVDIFSLKPIDYAIKQFDEKS